MWSTTLTRRDHFHLQDLDGTGTCTVTGRHVTVALGDGTCDGDVAVLSVHVVSATSRVVTNLHSEILHRCLILLENLLTRNNLTNRLLQFLQFLHVVPESGFGGDDIGSEDSHSEDRRLGVLLGRDTTTDDFEFLQLSETLHDDRFESMILISVTICSLIFFICPH